MSNQKSNLPAKTQSEAVAKPTSTDVLIKTLRQDLYNRRKEFAGLLGTTEDSQLFVSYLAEVAHVVGLNPTLLAADRHSLMMSLRHAITQGLSINPALGEAYLIPRWDKSLKANVVQCQRGYQGLLALMFRSEMIDSVFADVIYREEVYKIYGGTNARIEHEPDTSGELRTNVFDDIDIAYANVYLKGSTRPIFVYLTHADLKRSRAMNLNSKGEPSGPWRDHPQAMAIKTALARVCKMLPRHSKLADLHKALAAEVETTGSLLSQGEPPELAAGKKSPWETACEAFGRFEVMPERLLALLGIESGEQFTAAHETWLRDVYAQVKNDDWSAFADAGSSEPGDDAAG
jgi:recombination protein RecT